MGWAESQEHQAEKSFVLRTYIVGRMGWKSYLLTGKCDGQLSVEGGDGGCEYPKVLMGFFLWALWTLSCLSGLGMKAQFQGLLSQIVETIHRISRTALLPCEHGVSCDVGIPGNITGPGSGLLS